MVGVATDPLQQLNAVTIDCLGSTALADYLATSRSLLRMGLTFFTTEERALMERFLHFMILLDLTLLGHINEETGEELSFRAYLFRCRGLSITVRLSFLELHSQGLKRSFIGL